MQKSTTNNFEETQKVGRHLARQMPAKNLQSTAVVLALQGDLGAGKTTFLQGFAEGLGIREVVNSPTFVMLKRFELKGSVFKNFYHIDLYRIEDEKDINALDLESIIATPENIVAIEWPEKLGKLLPTDAILITFEHLEQEKREITIEK